MMSKFVLSLSSLGMIWKSISLYNQLVKGCGREFCTNKFCFCCPSTLFLLLLEARCFISNQEAGEEAIKIMKEKTAIVCSELLPARSINKEDLYEFTGTL